MSNHYCNHCSRNCNNNYVKSSSEHDVKPGDSMCNGNQRSDSTLHTQSHLREFYNQLQNFADLTQELFRQLSDNNHSNCPSVANISQIKSNKSICYHNDCQHRPKCSTEQSQSPQKYSKWEESSLQELCSERHNGRSANYCASNTPQLPKIPNDPTQYMESVNCSQCKNKSVSDNSSQNSENEETRNIYNSMNECPNKNSQYPERSENYDIVGHGNNKYINQQQIDILKPKEKNIFEACACKHCQYSSDVNNENNNSMEFDSDNECDNDDSLYSPYEANNKCSETVKSIDTYPSPEYYNTQNHKDKRNRKSCTHNYCQYLPDNNNGATSLKEFHYDNECGNADSSYSPYGSKLSEPDSNLFPTNMQTKNRCTTQDKNIQTFTEGRNESTRNNCLNNNEMRNQNRPSNSSQELCSARYNNRSANGCMSNKTQSPNLPKLSPRYMKLESTDNTQCKNNQKMDNCSCSTKNEEIREIYTSTKEHSNKNCKDSKISEEGENLCCDIGNQGNLKSRDTPNQKENNTSEACACKRCQYSPDVSSKSNNLTESSSDNESVDDESIDFTYEVMRLQSVQNLSPRNLRTKNKCATSDKNTQTCKQKANGVRGNNCMVNREVQTCTQDTNLDPEYNCRFNREVQTEFYDKKDNNTKATSDTFDDQQSLSETKVPRTSGRCKSEPNIITRRNSVRCSDEPITPPRNCKCKNSKPKYIIKKIKKLARSSSKRDSCQTDRNQVNQIQDTSADERTNCPHENNHTCSFIVKSRRAQSF